jgi:hypothetical protein
MPKLRNIKLIDMNITAGYMGICSELQFLEILKILFMNLLLNVQFITGGSDCFFFQIEQIRTLLVKDYNEFEDVFVIDSM